MAKFAISAGHSIHVAGARGNGLDEATEVNAIAPMVVEQLRARSHRADMAPNIGRTQKAYLQEEWSHANNYGGTGVSIHMNSFGSSSATGVEVFYYRPSAYKTAVAVSAQLAKDLGIKNRGAKKAGYEYLRSTKGPAILVEICFLSNSGDVAAYNRLGRAGVAKSIVDGLVGYWYPNQIPTPTSPSTSTPTPAKPRPNSIVDYLNSIGVDSSYSNRKILAEKHGIQGYKGTADQNIRLLTLMQNEKASASTPVATPAPTPPSKGSTYSGPSIVEYLNSIDIDSSYSNRSRLAVRYGIANYTGTAEQNTKLLYMIRDGAPVTRDVVVSKPAKPKSSYTGPSIVTYLNSIGVDSSYKNRAKLAVKHGIKNYKGTAAQNTKLLNILR